MNFLSRLFLVSSLLLTTYLLLTTSALSQSSGTIQPTLAPRSHEAEFPVLSSQEYVRHRWQGDYLVSTGLHASPSVPVVVLHDRSGHAVFNGTVWFENAREVELSDGALAPDGSLVVAGGARNADGTIANFIAKLTRDGVITNVVQTSPYVAYYLQAAPDGTVWTLGLERDANLHQKKDFAVLRQYSFEKGKLAEMLSSRTFSETLSQGSSQAPWYASFPGGVMLGNKNQSIGFYSARTAEWIELDLRTHEIARHKLDPLRPGVEVTGVAYTDSGKVFASLIASGQAASLSGLAELTAKSPSVSQWTMVGQTVSKSNALGDPPTFSSLLGSAGSQLVYRTESYPSTTVAWSKEP
jgi:hypothetical protein